jgi:membrane-bound serine protease (ClpP class)
MIPRIFCFFGVALSLLLSPLESRAAEPAATIKEGEVAVVPLKGEVNEAQFLFLRRMLKQAEAAGAAAFVVNMDTPGGSLAAAVKIVDLLLKSTIPTFTYVNTNAGSAGALIALATQHIYMAPVSAIGAAAPVLSGGADPPEAMTSKIVSYYSGYFRSAAEANGHNPDVAEAFINRDKEVKIGETVINKEGDLLTLSSQEAVREYEGKPLLAAGIAPSLRALVDKAGFEGAEVVELQPSGFERAAQIITSLAPLFLLGGIIGAYLEFKSPGFGVAGFVSGCCFLLFFAGHYVAGLTGFEVLAVFVLGVILIVFELIFFPGILLFSLLGVALMLGSLLFAMMDYWPSRPFVLSFEMVAPALTNLGLAMVLAIFVIVLLARFLPSLPVLGGIFLHASSAPGSSVPGPARSLFAGSIQIGDLGVAHTPLRPSGRADFGALQTDVVTEGDFLDAGTRVRITSIQGSKVSVVPVEEPS